MLELLAWVASRPRTYAETIDAWRSNCPRLAVWDDAVVDGLIRIVRDDGRVRVDLTELGRSLLPTPPPPP
jgi:hypothetical protein